MQPTLLVLAAGMGSRYGGLKQVDQLGPNGQKIIDYSAYDAIRAGFGKIVFVIRKDIEKEFNDLIISKISNKIKVEYVFQELDNLPEGIQSPEDRVKPWGTGHAVLVAKDKVNEPFVVINADDFYGSEAFNAISDYLQNLSKETTHSYAMVGYRLKNTLSEHGYVSRGVCNANENGNLTDISEHTHIEKSGNKIIYKMEDKQGYLPPDTPVSMNFWGFTPDLFDEAEQMFRDFIIQNINNPKAEFYIPTVVDTLIKSGKAKAKLLTSDAQWFGVTYKEDKPVVMQKLKDLHTKGVYPDTF